MRKKRKLYKKPLTVVFCITGGPFSHNFLKCWTALHGFCLQNNIKPILINPQSSVVYYARNLCLGGDVRRGINQKPFDGKIDYDYLMWIDSDMVFSVKDFTTRLILFLKYPFCEDDLKVNFRSTDLILIIFSIFEG